jgi:hypothetical protein
MHGIALVNCFCLFSHIDNCKYALLNSVLQHISISYTVTSLCRYVWRYMRGNYSYTKYVLFQINGYDGYEDTKKSMIIVFC